MNKLQIFLLMLILLLIPLGAVGAQSSASYAVQRTVLLSGGVTDSANYAVTAVIGQADTDTSLSTNYKVSAGFLFPMANRLEFKTWLPSVLK